ncbi:MAG: hypothetical protein WC875_04125 [Candidatus Absconditabacterales bacterium]|jgi:predicted RNase H-like HicB family nuclease
MKTNFHIILRQEGKTFIGRIMENNVSSFGKTEKECLENTKEALDLFLENEKIVQETAIKFPRLLEISYQHA